MSTRRASRFPSRWIRMPSPTLKAIVFSSPEPAVPPMSTSVSGRWVEGNRSIPSPPLPRSRRPAPSVPTAFPVIVAVSMPSPWIPPKALPEIVLSTSAALSGRRNAVAVIMTPQTLLGSGANWPPSVPMVFRSINSPSTFPITVMPLPTLPEMMFRPGSVPSPITQSWIADPSGASNRMPSIPLGRGRAPVTSVPTRFPITALLPII